VVKYLFWACDQDTGIFEHLNEEDLLKYKRMSKYKKDELAAKKFGKQHGDSESDEEAPQSSFSDQE